MAPKKCTKIWCNFCIFVPLKSSSFPKNASESLYDRRRSKQSFFKGQKKRINFFNINFLPPTHNPRFWAPRKKFTCLISWERTQKRHIHINFSGDSGGQKQGPKRAILGHNSSISCFFLPLYFGGWPGSPENVSCSRATPDLHRCNLGVALEQVAFSGPPGHPPKIDTEYDRAKVPPYNGNYPKKKNKTRGCKGWERGTTRNFLHSFPLSGPRSSSHIGRGKKDYLLILLSI